MTHVYKFCIYANPRGVHGWSAWMNYAAKQGVKYDDRRWFSDDPEVAAKAKRFGMLVAEVSLV